VFRHLKEYEMTGTTGLLKQSAISLAALRVFLRDVPLFRMRDLDIIIKRLGVAYVSTVSVCVIVVQDTPEDPIDSAEHLSCGAVDVCQDRNNPIHRSLIYISLPSSDVYQRFQLRLHGPYHTAVP
jgi:hypothetical protein